ncbi:MAG: hypothetical protein ABW217_23610 [Polyangiaceae bacterium]
MHGDDQPLEDAPPSTIELPAPTAAPLITAFGVTLSFAGLATHAVVSGLGVVLALLGLVSWFKDVLPHPAHERIRVVDAPVAVSTRRREIERVHISAAGRANLPLEIYPISAGVRGGLWGSLAMAILALLYGVISGHGVWYPINLLAAGFWPSASMAELSRFHAGAFAVAFVIHGLTSLLVGVLYGAMLPLTPRRPVVLGGLVAPLLWTGLLYSSLELINPVLAQRIDWGWFFFSQLGFGLVAGWVVSKRERIATLQPLPWRVRAGVEAPGLQGEASSKGANDV